jgi:hypothetical protein
MNGMNKNNRLLAFDTSNTYVLELGLLNSLTLVGYTQTPL